jgi:DNA-binding NarL/FixJ family response regulator
VPPAVRKPRVILTDDHTLVAEGFAKLLEADFDVVGCFSEGRTLLDQAATLEPDVVIMDLAMPLLNGIDAGHQLKKLLPSVKIIVLTVCEDAEVAASLMREWASGFLLKKSASVELLKAIREVLQGKSYVTTYLTQSLIESFIRNPLPVEKKPLTERQREVLQLLAEGGTLKEIANVLKLATRTVAYHKYRIMEEYGLKTNSDLVLLAIEQRIIAGPSNLDLKPR